MNLTVENTTKLSGEVKAPPSKSYTIRAVVAGLLAEGVSTIKDPLYSEDTKAAINASLSLGAKIKKTEEGLKISGVVGLPKAPKNAIDTLNSGTTIRIMTAVASLCNSKITLTGDESIRRRPIEPLLAALRQLGVKANSENSCPPVTVQGPIRGGICKIDGGVSSQFISALLMALPCARGNSTIEIVGKLRSKPYIDLTLNMLDKFKVRVGNDGDFRFIVPGDQTYKATEYTVEGDYSSAAFLLAAAALTKSKVTVRNLFKDSKQADKKIIQILRSMGADVSLDNDSVTVIGGNILKGTDIDLNDSPDLLPIASVLGAVAAGRTVIHNVAHARIKECDRIRAMYTELKKMNATIVERQDGLEITSSRLKGTLVEGWHDHHIVMALAIAGLKAEGKTEITDREYVGVTFPNFIEVMKNMGANIN